MKKTLDKTRRNNSYRRKQSLCSMYRKNLKKTATKGELKLKNLLDEFNIKYIFQKGWLSKTKTFYISDFYLPQVKTVIEVDGISHCSAKQQRKDMEKDSYYKKHGFNIVRINF